jgi:hypothetical protein
MKENEKINQLINEDGTSMENFPKNPLKEKWDKLYPPIPKVEYSQVCDGYSCMWCGRCPNGEYWKVPEEDIEIWNNYQEQIRQYNQLHNPDLTKTMDDYLQKVLIKEKK